MDEWYWRSIDATTSPYTRLNQYLPGTETDYWWIRKSISEYVYETTRVIFALRADSTWYKLTSSLSYLLNEDGTTSDIPIGFRISYNHYDLTDTDTPSITLNSSCYFYDYLGNIIKSFIITDVAAGNYFNSIAQDSFTEPFSYSARNYNAKILGAKTNTLSIILEYHQLCASIGAVRDPREFLISADIQKRQAGINIEDIGITSGNNNLVLSALIESAFNLAYANTDCPEGVWEVVVPIQFAR